MSFKSQVGKVNAGLAAGSFKKADPDPYGLQGFAEQVTFGIRAEADARRKEDFLKKQEESAIRKERAKLQQAKEAADLQMGRYINRALYQVSSGFPGSPKVSLSTLKPRILTAVKDMGITTYKGVLDLLEGNDDFKIQLNSLWDTPTEGGNPPIVETGSSTDSSVSVGDTSVSTGGSSVSSTSKPTSGSTDLTEAADKVIKESDNLFPNTAKAFNVNTLSIDTWETELDKLKSAYELTPNKFPNYDEDVANIQEYANNKGWVMYGDMSLSDIRNMTAPELRAKLRQTDKGIGAKLTPEKRATLEEFAIAKEEIEKDDLYWNKPQELFERLADPQKKLVLLTMLKTEEALNPRSQQVKNIKNAITIFDAVQSDQPLSDEILEKMVGASANTIKGLKTIYYDDANADQKLMISKLESLAKENDASKMKPKETAYTSWADRIGLKDLLNGTNANRENAEILIAEWERKWEATTKQSKEFWQKLDNLSKMSLEEVDILLDTGLISQAEDPDAFLVLDTLKKKLEANQGIEKLNELDGLDTTNKLSNYLILNAEDMKTNPKLQKLWQDLFTEVRSQEMAATAAEDIDPDETARRAYLLENRLDLKTMTFDEINTMERKLKEGTTVVDDSDPIIEGSDLFRLADGQYVRRTKSGKLRNTFTNAIVEVPANTPTQPVSVEIQNQIDKQFTRLRDDLLTPMSDTQNKSLATIRSAKRLSDMANANPEVLNIVGDLTSILGRLKITTDVFNSYLDRGLSTDQFAKEVTGGIDSEKLVGSARAKALFDAEILKYAYLYASINLEQSGRGLSDTDFKQALRQVNAGTGGLEAFDLNIRKLTKETYGKVRRGIETAFGSTETGKGANTEILRLETLIGKLSGFPRDMDEFVKFNRLQEETSWLNAETSSTIEPPSQTGNFLGDGLTLEGIDPNVISIALGNLNFLKGRLKENGEPMFDLEAAMMAAAKQNNVSLAQMKLIAEGSN